MSIEQVDVKTPEQVSLRFKLAGLGSRATAHILDIIFLIILILIISYSLGKLAGDFFYNIKTVSNFFYALLVIFYFLLFWGYFVFFEYFTSGQTLGKKIVGIRVIQDSGQSITFLSSLIRNLLRIIDFMPSLYMVGIIMLIFHSQHKRLGDLSGGTIVVFERKNNKRKQNLIEKEIWQRGITKDYVSLDSWTLKKMNHNEWKILKTYLERRLVFSVYERKQITLKVAKILLPLINVDISNKSIEELENNLFSLYLNLKEEYEFKI